MTSIDPLPLDPAVLQRLKVTAVFHVPVVPQGAAGLDDPRPHAAASTGEPELLFLEIGSRSVSALKQEFFRLYEAEVRPRLEALAGSGTKSPIQQEDVGRSSNRLPESVRAPLWEFLHRNPAWLERDYVLVLLNWDALTMVQPAESRAVPARALMDAVRRFQLLPRMGDAAADERFGHERGLQIAHVTRTRRNGHGA